MEDEINLLDYWHVIKKRWKIIALISGFAVITAGIISLLMTPIFQAQTTIMPIEAPSTALSALTSISSSLPFMGYLSGIPKSSSEKLVSVLESRTVTEDVIGSLNLIKVIFSDSWDDGNNRWKDDEPPTIQDTLKVLSEDLVNIDEDRKGLITISIEYKDPQLAANIANEYMSALRRFLNENSLSLAKKNRLFIEDQIRLVKEKLAAAEDTLKNFQIHKKVLALDEQAKASIEAIATIKAQIATKEVQLGVMHQFATPKNPDVQRVKNELRELKKQLALLESKKSNPESHTIPSVTDAPEVGLEYLRLKRQALTQEKIFELLTEQYQLARIEEAKDEVAFQIIDPAIPPEKKIKPKRALIVMLAGTVSLFAGIFLVFFLEYLENIKQSEYIRTQKLENGN